MCFGSPKAQEVKYVGPSKEDIGRQEAALADYQLQIDAQQKQFAADLQSQIDDANAETERITAELAAETASAMSAANAQTSSYITTAAQTEVPEAAQTTETVGKKKKKPGSTLRIASGATPSTAGSGLNIGV